MATVLALTAIISIPLAYYAHFQWRNAQVEKMREEAISLGGYCNVAGYDTILGSLGIYESCLEEMQLDKSRVTDEDLLRWPIRHSTKLEEVSLADTSISDRGLSAFEGLSCVRKLWLNNTKIHGDGLAYISTMSGLESLDLDGTAIHSEDLRHLSKLTTLKYLSLVGTRIDGKGLVHLQHLAQLEDLYLDNTFITDDDLAPLEHLKELRDLRLEGTQVTAEAIDGLLRKLPQFKVSPTH